MPSGLLGSFEFDWGKMGANLGSLSERVDGYVHAVMDRQAGKALTYMKTEAPWTDRTGNARNGLGADVDWKPQESHTIRLFHRMWYGVFLETRWAGRFAIIMPTIQKFGPETLKLLDRLFEKMGVNLGAE